MVKFLLFCILLVLCWPLALVALILYPLVWLLLLPFRVVGIAVGACILFYATANWTAIGPGEVGLLQRQGRYVARLDPGLHLRFPPPFERVTRLAPARVQSLEIGFRSGGTANIGAVRWESAHQRDVVARAEDEALLLTGDGHLVELAATAQYRIDESKPEALRAYAFGVADADGALRPLAESAVRTVVGQVPLDRLLTSDRHETELAAARLLQERISAYGLGLVVTGVAFQDVHPPLAVVDAYRDVSRAESDRKRRTNEGNTYAAEQLAKAKGKADTTVNRAEAERQGRVDRASGEADAFGYELAARSAFPTLTDHRLYWEMIAAALAGKNKVVLDSDKASHRHLFVPLAPIESIAPALMAPTSARREP